MYQTVGHDAVHLVAQALDLPLFRKTITGQAVNQDLQYRRTSESDEGPDTSKPKDETEDLLDLLLEVKRHHPDVEAVSVGAILSNYQRIRVEHVALRPELQLTPLTFLWQRSQDELLDEMVKTGMNAVLIKVAGAGLDERDLGKSLAQMQPKLRRLNSLYGAHVCGEGGEYETLTLDCPLFKRRINLVETEVVTHAEAAFASVAYLKITKAELVPKDSDSNTTVDQVIIPSELDNIGEITRAAAAKSEEMRLSIANLRQASGTLEEEHARKTFQQKETPVDGPTRQVESRDGCSPPEPLLTRSRGWIHVSNVRPTMTGDVEEEVASMFARLQRVLHRESLSMKNLTHLNLYLSNQDDFARVNAVYKTMFGEAPPSRACVGFSSQSPPVSRIFLDATGHEMIEELRSLHVQGRSYWAPANIGPYSQAMLAGERTSIAGQIGLRPADLTLPSEFDRQCALSLQHARRIHAAVLEGAHIPIGSASIEGGVCWLEDIEDPTVQPDGRLTRVLGAQAAWSAQSPAQLEEDAGSDDDETERLDETKWLGAGRTPSDLPMVFAFVPHSGLPRGAAVEWQLTACTGRSVRGDPASDDEAEDVETGFDRVTPISVQRIDFILTLGSTQMAVHWHQLSAHKSGSAFSIVSIRHLGPSSATSVST
ncbi:hypothetical protein OC846_003701, partial [Tilletia horrida]